MKIVSALLIALVICTPWIGVGSAVAQGTSGTLPGPISSRMLNRYADRLELSRQQRLALETLHADYKRDFSILRSGEIELFLRAQGKTQGGIPDRDVVDDLVDDFRRISAKIKALDESLFDRLTPLLTEAQREMLPRVRMARERDRYRPQQVMILFGRKMPDLSDLVQDLALEGPLPAETDHILGSYERTFTSRMRKQNKELTELTANLMDALAERGYGTLTQEEILADPEMLQRLMADMQTIWAELNADAAELSDQMRELNKRTSRRLCETLPDGAARRLRGAFLRAGYPQISRMVAMGEQPWLDAKNVDAVKGLTSEQREMLAIEADTFLRKLAALEDEAVTATDRYHDSISFFDAVGNQEVIQSYRKDLSRVQASATELNERTTERLRTALGDETWIRLAEARSAEAQKVDVALGGGEAAPTADEAAFDYWWSGDSFLPTRIGRRDVLEYARRLGFDDGLSEIVTSLQGEYATLFKDLESIATLVEAKGALNETRDPDADVPITAGAELIDRIHALRRQSIAEIEALETQLFDEITALADEEMVAIVERLRAERMARVLSGSARTTFSLGLDRSSAARVDVLAIITRQPWASERDTLIGPVFDEYLGQVVPLLRERVEAQLELDRVYERWTSDIAKAAGADMAALVETQQRFNEIMAEPVKRGNEIDTKVMATNQQAVEAIASRLGADDAFTFRRQYNTAAYPDVYKDDSAVGDQLTAAMALYDLTTDQRAQLGDIATTYRSEYDGLSESMVELLGNDTAYFIGIDQDRIAQWQERQQAIGKLRFERNELNAQAIIRLQNVLTEEQVRRIGGLPEPEEPDDRPFWQ